MKNRLFLRSLLALAGVCSLNTAAAKHLDWYNIDGNYRYVAELNAYMGSAAQNAQLTISDWDGKRDVEHADHLYGGYAVQGKVQGNSLSFTGGGTHHEYVYGGYNAELGDVLHNSVFVNCPAQLCCLYGGYSETEGNASYNSVTALGVAGLMHNSSGGWAEKGDACGNSFVLRSSAAVVPAGEFISFCGGETRVGHADGNSVVLEAGTGGVLQVFGGFSNSGGHANGNSATICGTDVLMAAGGCGEKADNNTVNLVGEGGRMVLNAETTLQGRAFSADIVLGGVSNAAVPQPCRNNTLNVYGKNITIGTLGQAEGMDGRFARINFCLPEGAAAGDVILHTQEADVRGSRITVQSSGATLLQEGDTLTLIASDDLQAEGMSSSVRVMQGAVSAVSGRVDEVGENVLLTITGAPQADPNSLKMLMETRCAAVALVNSGADFLSRNAVAQVSAAFDEQAEKLPAVTFAAAGASDMRYNTGSHVNADTYHLALGAARRCGRGTYALAGEYGNSSYDSAAGGLSGSGQNHALGAALLGDWQFRRGWHADAELRMGRVDYRYRGALLNAGTPVAAAYEDDALYTGAIIGGGREYRLSESGNSLDLYARYYYSHLNASSARLNTGESIRFRGVDSHRSVLGARYNHRLNERDSLYCGAAWVHEFKGDTHGSVAGFEAPAPSLKGSSAMLELGAHLKPFESERVMLNLNLRGWGGTQRGVSAGAGISLRF